MNGSGSVFPPECKVVVTMGVLTNPHCEISTVVFIRETPSVAAATSCCHGVVDSAVVPTQVFAQGSGPRFPCVLMICRSFKATCDSNTERIKKRIVPSAVILRIGKRTK